MSAPLQRLLANPVVAILRGVTPDTVLGVHLWSMVSQLLQRMNYFCKAYTYLNTLKDPGIIMRLDVSASFCCINAN